MRAVCQRVSSAKVEVDGVITGEIERGLLVYLGVGGADTAADAAFLADKIVNLRIFPDDAGKMNLSVLDVGGRVLLVSNFTLFGDCRKGRRPGFDLAGAPEMAEALYESVGRLIGEAGVGVATGVFGGSMQVSSVNEGPVNFLLDSTRLF